MNTEQLFIAGSWRRRSLVPRMPTINPATEETSAPGGPGATERDVELAVAAAGRRSTPETVAANERGRARADRVKLGDLIMQNLDEMARLESLNTARRSSIRAGRDPFAAEVFRYYAAGPPRSTVRHSGFGRTRSRSRCASPWAWSARSCPWNFPFLLSSWKIGPGAGRGQHGGAQARLADAAPPRSSSPELTQEAGLPEGVFNVVTGPGGQVGMAMVRDPRVDKIAFTGSTR